jgi:hypothetical protein
MVELPSSYAVIIGGVPSGKLRLKGTQYGSENDIDVSENMKIRNKYNTDVWMDIENPPFLLILPLIFFTS